MMVSWLLRSALTFPAVSDQPDPGMAVPVRVVVQPQAAVELETFRAPASAAV